VRLAAASLAGGLGGGANSASLAQDSPPEGAGRIPVRPLRPRLAPVGVVGLGCPQAPGYPSAGELGAIVRLFLDRGANVLEVSCVHGNPGREEELARALAGRRAEAFLVATLSPRGGVLAQIDDILKRLGTDRLDLCCLSGAKNDYTLRVVLDRDLPELRRARAQGKVLLLGADCRSSAATARTLVESAGLDAVTIPLSLVRREFAEEVLPAAESRGVGVIAIEPFNYGELLRRPKGLERVLGGTVDEAHARALEFVLAFPVASVLVGWESAAAAELSLAVASRFRGLSEEAVSRTAFGRERTARALCRACGNCLPCPVKINIPQVHRQYAMATHYGFIEYARACYSAERVKASECIRCGRCDRRCPYKLPVEKTVIEAHAVLSGG